MQCQRNCCFNTLYIDRSSRKESMNKLNNESETINNNAAKLVILPEGTRHDGWQLLPFKKGPFHIAIQSQSSIQPIVVSKYTFLNSKLKIFSKGFVGL